MYIQIDWYMTVEHSNIQIAYIQIFLNYGVTTLYNSKEDQS